TRPETAHRYAQVRLPQVSGLCLLRQDRHRRYCDEERGRAAPRAKADLGQVARRRCEYASFQWLLLIPAVEGSRAVGAPTSSCRNRADRPSTHYVHPRQRPPVPAWHAPAHGHPNSLRPLPSWSPPARRSSTGLAQWLGFPSKTPRLPGGYGADRRRRPPPAQLPRHCPPAATGHIRLGKRAQKIRRPRPASPDRPTTILRPARDGLASTVG